MTHQEISDKTERIVQAYGYRDYSDSLLKTAASYVEASFAPGLRKDAAAYLVSEARRLRSESRAAWTHGANLLYETTGEYMSARPNEESHLKWAEQTLNAHLSY